MILGILSCQCYSLKAFQSLILRFLNQQFVCKYLPLDSFCIRDATAKGEKEILPNGIAATILRNIFHCSFNVKNFKERVLVLSFALCLKYIKGPFPP